jgi:hypothetical protein
MGPTLDGGTSFSRVRPTLFVVALFLLIVSAPFLAWRMTDVGNRRDYGRFLSTTVAGAGVEIVGIQRLPTAWDGEENAYVRSLESPDSPLLEFDINGRFGDQIRVDLSTDARWARIWLAHEPPLIGEEGVVAGDSSYFLNHALGQTARQDVFPGSVIAYANLGTRFVLRAPTATVRERVTLLGLRPALPDEDMVRGEKVRWHRTTHR